MIDVKNVTKNTFLIFSVLFVVLSVASIASAPASGTSYCSGTCSCSGVSNSYCDCDAVCCEWKYNKCINVEYATATCGFTCICSRATTRECCEAHGCVWSGPIPFEGIKMWIKDPNGNTVVNGVTMGSCTASGSIHTCSYKYYSCSVKGYYQGRVQETGSGVYSSWTNLWYCNPCTRANPTVTLSPSSQSSPPGETKSYTVSVKNNDNSYCGSSSFGLKYTCPAGFSCSLTDTALTISYGSTASTTLSVTPTTAPAGDYTVSATATNNGATSYKKSESATYTVMAVCGNGIKENGENCCNCDADVRCPDGQTCQCSDYDTCTDCGCLSEGGLFWKNLGANNTSPFTGQGVEFYSQWSDDEQLGKYIFSWNGSGTNCDAWGNDTGTNFQTGNWTNTTKTIPSACEGKLIGYRFYANDTSNNWAATSILRIGVIGICNFNGICDVNETQNGCPEDCKTIVSVYPPSLYPGDNVTVTVYFNDSRYVSGKETKLSLYIDDAEWTNCIVHEKNWTAMGWNRNSDWTGTYVNSMNGREYKSNIRILSLNSYAKIIFDCTVPEDLAQGTHTIRAVPSIYSEEKILESGEAEFSVEDNSIQSLSSVQFLKYILTFIKLIF
jgi:hypothetical protein